LPGFLPALAENNDEIASTAGELSFSFAMDLRMNLSCIAA